MSETFETARAVYPIGAEKEGGWCSCKGQGRASPCQRREQPVGTGAGQWADYTISDRKETQKVLCAAPLPDYARR